MRRLQLAGTCSWWPWWESSCAKLDLCITHRELRQGYNNSKIPHAKSLSTGGFSLNMCMYVCIHTVGVCQCKSVWSRLRLQVGIFIKEKNLNLSSKFFVLVHFEFSVVLRITTGCMLFVISCFYSRQVSSAQLLFCYYFHLPFLALGLVEWTHGFIHACSVIQILFFTFFAWKDATYYRRVYWW